ncbi:transglycosylase domain-containing protein [Gorillibacterium timonense]|uniref:transglycosylase domain-containing protein n=1 Tax=Gorillibacterium timonense TaxID=1689269 RepID=UPI00071C80D0|nr:PBP1A family penicillin-binding protein [Gorillibacterium timonense]
MGDDTRSPKERESWLIRWARRIKRISAFVLSFGVVLAACLLLALLYLRSQALPAVSFLQTSILYDADGVPFDSLTSGQNRQPVTLADISPYLVKGAVAIEDRRFYSHPGIDPKGLARAILTDLKSMSREQGASTITQQLARNLYLSHDRTWSRKAKEAVYTIQMELQYDKNEILAQYLNQIYFGHSTYGVQAAARMFFGKDAKDLTLAEASLMIGVPKGPRYYSPYLNMENAKSRQKLVLAAMVKEGDITQAEAEAAYRETLHIVPLEDESRAAVAPYFRDYIRRVVEEKLKISEPLYDSGGLRIYTTLNREAQQAAEDAVARQVGTTGELQAALVSIDPRTGYIKAMVGGKNYAQNQYNRVFTTTRQPGSSFKPVVYLTALANRFSPLTAYMDEPTDFPYDEGKQIYHPNNYDSKYTYEQLDMRQAIAKSNNIYAVHTLVDVGADNVIATARRMGITSRLEPLPSLALGTYPVSPFEMAAAFGSIANLGVRVEPTAVLRIEDSLGRVLYRAHPEEIQVADPAQAYVLTSLMESVFEEGGTGYRVTDLMKRPAAGKTGTTNTDAWMVGFTPELATAVWVGYDQGRTISSAEAHKAAPIFAEYTEKALAAVPPKQFTAPDGVVSVYVDPKSGKLANQGCAQSRLEVFVSGTEPTDYCTEAPALPAPTPSPGKGSWWSDFKRWWND